MGFKLDSTVKGEQIQELFKKGYTIFAPDNFYKMGQQMLDLETELLDKLKMTGADEVAESIAKSIDKCKENMTNFNIDKNIAYIKKADVYAVPMGALDALKKESEFVLGRGFEMNVRLLYDIPTISVWRKGVLYYPGWVVNNLIGNVVFNTMAGILPTAYFKAMMRDYMEYVPEAVKGSTFTAEQILGRGKAGGAYNVEWWAREIKDAKGNPVINKKDGETLKKGYPVGQNTFKLQQGIEKVTDATKVLPAYEKMVTGANELVEGNARGAHYIQKAIGLAKRHAERKYGKVFSQAMNDIDALKYARNNAEVEAQAVKSVNEFLNDYRNAGRFERQVIKRIFPFWSFMKHSTTLATTYAFKHPKTALLLKETLINTVNKEKDDRDNDVIREAQANGNADYRRNFGVDLYDTGHNTKVSYVPSSANPFSSISAAEYAIYDALDKQGSIADAIPAAVNEAGLGLSSSPLVAPAIAMLMGIDPYTGKAYEKQGQINGWQIDPTTGLPRRGLNTIAPAISFGHPLSTFGLAAIPYAGTPLSTLSGYVNAAKASPYYRAWKLSHSKYSPYAEYSADPGVLKGSKKLFNVKDKDLTAIWARLVLPGIKERDETQRKISNYMGLKYMKPLIRQQIMDDILNNMQGGN
jgi:hypothetical protein